MKFCPTTKNVVNTTSSERRGFKTAGRAAVLEAFDRIVFKAAQLSTLTRECLEICFPAEMAGLDLEAAALEAVVDFIPIPDIIAIRDGSHLQDDASAFKARFARMTVVS